MCEHNPILTKRIQTASNNLSVDKENPTGCKNNRSLQQISKVFMVSYLMAANFRQFTTCYMYGETTDEILGDLPRIMPDYAASQPQLPGTEWIAIIALEAKNRCNFTQYQCGYISVHAQHNSWSAITWNSYTSFPSMCTINFLLPRKILASIHS